MEDEPPQTTNYKCPKNHYEHKHKVKSSKIISKQNESENTRTRAKTAAPAREGRRRAWTDKTKNSRCLQIAEIHLFESQGQFIVNEMQYSMQFFTSQTVTLVLKVCVTVLGGSSRVPPPLRGSWRPLIGVIAFNSMLKQCQEKNREYE